MAYISQITLPNNSTYNLKDSRVDNLGTAAEKNFTTTITSGGTDLPTAGAVYTAIQNSTPTETDPTVPAWAKTSTKPSYTDAEITTTGEDVSTWGSNIYTVLSGLIKDHEYYVQTKADSATTLSGYGITDAYTKTEIDSLVASVLHYKGTKATVSALPSSGNTLGDVWHVTADGSEWAWDGTEWQELGTAVDLSGYLQTGDIAAWAKASTKPSYTASEISGAVRVDGSYGSPVYAYGVYGLASTGTVQIPVYSATITNDNQITTKKYVDDAISGISGLQHILDGSTTGSVRTSGSKSEGSSYTIGNNAFAEGYFTEAKGISSHAEGHTTSAVGNYSHAQGGSTTASGSYAHAEGSRTTAGNYAHAQGESTIASGQYSHAQGQGTTASGIASHASGTGTTAQRKSQYTFGQYNILDTIGTISTRGDYVFIIGNGTADAARSNALTVDWNGNLATAGNVTANGNQLSGVQIIRW